MPTLCLVCSFVLMMALGCASESPTPSETKSPELLSGLGARSRPITTSSPEAQRYFDQGLALVYGFNHEAAVRSFEEAARLDPSCASCQWGIALALGPNINAPMGPEAAKRAHAAAARAVSLSGGVTPVERDLIMAVSVRYTADPPEDRAALDLAFADAMRGVRADHPDDTDIATITAEALMDLYPWDYWTEDGEPREHTGEIVELLEWVIEKDPDHLGANHYYIHAVEKFTPEKGVPSAERLAALAPDSGHLVHMPSHIFWRVGRYDDAAEINLRAAAADEAYFAVCQPGPFYRSVYYPHNLHFLWAAASTEGRSELALSTARKLEAETRGGLGEVPFLQEFVSTPTLTLVRFGRFDAALGLPAPDPKHAYLAGIHHYARGVALARSGRGDEAATELTAVRSIQKSQLAKELILAGGTASASTLLAIAEAHLEGEIAAAKGDSDSAVAALERAVSVQDSLVYMEPPPWYFPTRQALGAVLLDAGRSKEAEAVFRLSLDHYPSNGWSLYGLAASFDAQGKAAEAKWARQGFENAWARADVKLEAARF